MFRHLLSRLPLVPTRTQPFLSHLLHTHVVHRPPTADPADFSSLKLSKTLHPRSSWDYFWPEGEKGEKGEKGEEKSSHSLLDPAVRLLDASPIPAFSYAQLHHDSDVLAGVLSEHLDNLQEESIPNIAYLFRPGYGYVVTNWAIWKLGCVVVPLCPSHPVTEMEYVITDAECDCLVIEKEFIHLLSDENLIANCDENMVVVEVAESELKPWEMSDSDIQIEVIDEFSDNDDDDLDWECAMMYTSGTTGPPKGVVHTAASISAQISNLAMHWRIDSADQILHILPLHHIHGFANALHTSLCVGASVNILRNKTRMWDFFETHCSVFHAVPTIYVHLLEQYERADSATQVKWSENASCCVRLMVSGSAALSEPVFDRWEGITGHRLLERYGMTEIGMALSNPYEPLEGRKSGCVGKPFDNVEVRLLVPEEEGDGGDEKRTEGELYVKGPTLFSRYYNRETETADSFDEDGFFRTGDLVSIDEEEGDFSILGRLSQDIIKSAGYKISALDIERVLLGRSDVSEACVVGVPDEKYGEIIGAVLVMREGKGSFDREEMMAFLREKLAPYKVPRVYRVLDAIPRNQMGKVNKRELVKLVF